MVCSIFIASSQIRGWPAETVSPRAAPSRITAPGIGAIVVAVWLSGHRFRDHAGLILLAFVFLFGRRPAALDADEADRYGLVSRVVADENLYAETMAVASTVASFSTTALMALKECVNRAYESSLSEGVLFERRELHARFATADAHEGMRAFMEKRKPEFQGR